MPTAERKRTGLSTTELSVLGLLSSGERSGYDLKKQAEVGVGYVWTAAKSHIYAVLPRLVAGGYATVRHVEQGRRPDKQVYRITKHGREAFRAWLEEPVDDRSGSRSVFLLKVFFGSDMSREALIAHIERKREDADARARRVPRDRGAHPGRGVVLLRLRHAPLGHRPGRGVDRVGERDPRGVGVRIALAVLASALVAVPAADAYKNPTRGRALVLQVPACTAPRSSETSSTSGRRG